MHFVCKCLLKKKDAQIDQGIDKVLKTLDIHEIFKIHMTVKTMLRLQYDSLQRKLIHAQFSSIAADPPSETDSDDEDLDAEVIMQRQLRQW